MWHLILLVHGTIISFTKGYSPDFLELLNTESARWSGWIKNSGKYDGWRSQNIPPNGQLVYGLCATQGRGHENWLRSPYIRREDALSVKLEITFTMRSCKSRPEQKGNCEDTFNLMIYESDSAAEVPSSWNERIYTTVAIVSPDIKWTDTRPEDDIVNIKTYNIEPRRNGFFLALRDTGSCVMVKRIRAFYVACASITSLLAKYPRVVVSHKHHIRNAVGICVPEAELIDGQKVPQLLCQPNGQWHILNTPFCHCKAGYTPSDNKMYCIKCPHNTFKTFGGSEKCIYCPKNAFSYPGASKCTCNDGLIPIFSTPYELSCTELPIIPQDIKANFTVDGQLHLTWTTAQATQELINTESWSKLYFKVICITCKESESLHFIPGSILTQPTVFVDALESGKTYKFSILSQRVKKTQIPKFSSSRSAFVTVTTEPADELYKIENLEIRTFQNRKFLSMSWSAPLNQIPLNYQIVIHSLGISSGDSKISVLDPILRTVKTTQYEFPYPKESDGRTLQIKVRARSKSAWGPFLSEQQISLNNTSKDVPANDPTVVQTEIWNSNKILIISVFIFALVLLLVVIPLCFFCKYVLSHSSKIRKKKHISKITTSIIDLPNYSQTLSGSFMTRGYIDPSTYEDPSIIVQEVAHEINPSSINIECVIGEGEFGEVCKGQLLSIDSRVKIPVAIKTLKSGCSEKEKMNFLIEAAIMGQYNHPNIIRLEGVVTKTQPIMILTQFIENGSLDSFLKKNKNLFSTLQLLSMLRGIASGMRYLSDMRYVHRDLAARNILVDKNLCCKVSDFGLSREIFSDTTEGAYTTKGGLIPIRWTAPEAINYRRFTSSSDVWSFGVVMWEVMSFGERPYWNWSNKDVIQSIESGYRLPAPRNCPIAVHLLMLDCWIYERAERPKFKAIYHSIDSLLRCPESLSTLSLSRSLGVCTPINVMKNQQHFIPISKKEHHGSRPLLESEPIFIPESPISQWLDCLDLPCYKDNFANRNLTCLGQISKFSRNDLVFLGITDSDHLRKIFSNIEAMRNYFEASFSFM